MIVPQSLFYQKPDLADRVSVLPSSTSYVKAFFTKTLHYLFSRKDAKDIFSPLDAEAHFAKASHYPLSRNAADSTRNLTKYYRAEPQRRSRILLLPSSSFIAQRRNAAAYIHPLTLSRSHALTLSRCLTRADAKDGVQWTKTNQACKDKYTSEDQQYEAKGSGNCAGKI